MFGLQTKVFPVFPTDLSLSYVLQRYKNNQNNHTNEQSGSFVFPCRDPGALRRVCSGQFAEKKNESLCNLKAFVFSGDEIYELTVPLIVAIFAQAFHITVGFFNLAVEVFRKEIFHVYIQINDFSAIFATEMSMRFYIAVKTGIFFVNPDVYGGSMIYE
jgi:hypothetical protein